MGKDVEIATCFLTKVGMVAGMTNDEALLCSGRAACCCVGGGTNVGASGSRQVSGSLVLVPILM